MTGCLASSHKREDDLLPRTLLRMVGLRNLHQWLCLVLEHWTKNSQGLSFNPSVSPHKSHLVRYGMDNMALSFYSDYTGLNHTTCSVLCENNIRILYRLRRALVLGAVSTT